MSEDYRYQCEDRSVLLPHYRRFLWEPLLPLVPKQASPNTLSLLANAFSAAALVVLLILEPDNRYLFIVPAILIFGYLTLDNLDGMFARLTGQTSPLGEFLDHWFDAFNSSFLVFGMYYSARIRLDIVLVLLAATNLAYFATFWEQRLTGRVFFGRTSQLEAVTAAFLVYLGIVLFGHPAMTSYRIFGLLSVVEIGTVALALGYAFQIGGCIWRTRRGLLEWVPLLLVSAVALVWYGVGAVGFFPIAALLVLSAAAGGRVVIARVLDRPGNQNDPVLIGGLALALLASVVFDLDPIMQQGLGWLIVLYLGGRVAYDFLTSVHALRRFLRPGEFLERALVQRQRPSGPS